MDVLQAPDVTSKPLPAAPLLRVENLHVRYPGATADVLRGVGFELAPREFVAVIGASGSGKSTLLRAINRLVEPHEGSVRLGEVDVTSLRGRDLRHCRRRMGMIFQEFNLIERYRVLDNVLLGRVASQSALRTLLALYPPAMIAEAVALLDRVGLGDFLDQRADALSGGQRQRVGICRALFQSPELLLVDEPTSSLDPRIANDIMALIRDLAQESGVAALCNIHDVGLARRFAARVIALRDGVVIHDGPFDALDEAALGEIYAVTDRSRL
ncbi:MAG: phosphonate ABC transporter ATP-binding protein [Geminicoccaceae bacterium]|nr:MAG: phosphonate ABC transporter ATP-binding protein [Geminicoccaceae bacterium]